MPRLKDQEIFSRIEQAMKPVGQPNQPATPNVAPATLQSLIQKAKAMRGNSGTTEPKTRGL